MNFKHFVKLSNEYSQLLLLLREHEERENDAAKLMSERTPNKRYRHGWITTIATCP